LGEHNLKASKRKSCLDTKIVAPQRTIQELGILSPSRVQHGVFDRLYQVSRAAKHGRVAKVDSTEVGEEDRLPGSNRTPS
jgi:hypothetical protein